MLNRSYRMKPRALCAADCGRRVSEPKGLYCSLRCMQRFVTENLYIQFLRGEYPPRSNSRFLRRAVVRYLGFESCSRCGWQERNPITGHVPVELEHIDGNWENNHPDNLTLLCPNCHSLTPTFRGLNRGHGRAFRLGGRLNPLRGQLPARGGPNRSLPKKPPAPAEPEKRQLCLNLADVA